MTSGIPRAKEKELDALLQECLHKRGGTGHKEEDKSALETLSGGPIYTQGFSGSVVCVAVF